MWDCEEIGNYKYIYINFTGEHGQNKTGQNKILRIKIHDTFMERYMKPGIRKFNLRAINSE